MSYIMNPKTRKKRYLSDGAAALEAVTASIGGEETGTIKYVPGGKCDYVCAKNRVPMAAFIL
jgi:hypothetical protein